MEEVVWSGNHTDCSKAAQQGLPSPPVPYSSLLGFLLLHLWLWNNQILSSHSFLQNLGSVQTSCLDATHSWPSTDENKSWQTKCVKSFVLHCIPGRPLTVRTVVSWSQSSLNPGLRAKTTLASCHHKCVAGESNIGHLLDTQHQRRFQALLRDRDEDYFVGSVFSEVLPSAADAIVPSLDIQRQRLSGFIATLLSFAHAKNVSIKMKDFPLLTVHNL